MESTDPTTVLLATFNGLKWLPAQIESILNQRVNTIDLVISDDMSTDGTWEWLQEISANDPRIVLLPRIGKFGGAGINFFRLLRDSNLNKCRYVGFADQDDIWCPEKLKCAQQTLRVQQADGYSSNVTAFWANGKTRLIQKAQAQRQWDFLFEAAGPGCTYVITAELALALQSTMINQWQNVSTIALHDWLTYAYARANGYKWIIDEKPNVHYRQHESNQVGANFGQKAFIHRANLVSSGWAIKQSASIAKIIGMGDHAFVRSWVNGNRWGILLLALKANQCRRRLRDRILFALSCLTMLLTRTRSSKN